MFFNGPLTRIELHCRDKILYVLINKWINEHCYLWIWVSSNTFTFIICNNPLHNWWPRRDQQIRNCESNNRVSLLRTWRARANMSLPRTTSSIPPVNASRKLAHNLKRKHDKSGIMDDASRNLAWNSDSFDFPFSGKISRNYGSN